MDVSYMWTFLSSQIVIQSFKPYYVAFFMITTLGIYS